MNDLPPARSADLCPADETELAAMIAEARAAGTPLCIEGGGTRDIGRRAQAAVTLSTRRLTGITLHEPAEMIVAARSGTPLSQVEAHLALQGQRLAFEPMDHRRLLGSVGEPTIGAVAAINASGPRRLAVGAARDSLVGIRFVNGRGETVKNGGRVMKNVTGLDLVKLLSGSFGTLGVLSEVTFKVSPIPQSTATLVFGGLDDAAGVALLTRAVGSPFEITGAAHLPGGLGRDTARTLLRIEGFEESVAYRLGALKALLAGFGVAGEVGGAEADDLWAAVRDAAVFAEHRDGVVWRVSVKPTDGPALLRQLGEGFSAAHYYDWAGGLVWLLVSDGVADGGAAKLRSVTRELGGHARMERGPPSLRATQAVFEPTSDALMRLTSGIKASFDPDGLLNPGRMYAGV